MNNLDKSQLSFVLTIIGFGILAVYSGAVHNNTYRLIIVSLSLIEAFIGWQITAFFGNKYYHPTSVKSEVNKS